MHAMMIFVDSSQLPNTSAEYPELHKKLLCCHEEARQRALSSTVLSLPFSSLISSDRTYPLVVFQNVKILSLTVRS